MMVIQNLTSINRTLVFTLHQYLSAEYTRGGCVSVNPFRITPTLIGTNYFDFVHEKKYYTVDCP